jgi:CheY-like chemotaxis protein
VTAGQRCVLYVEDNPANIHLMEAIVERLPDVALVSAHNAELALDLAAVHRPAVIVMDIGLPGMDGFEALKRLRQSRATRDIPVIAVSAAATKADVRKGLEAGFRDYLTKPIRVDGILAALRQALDANGGANDLPPPA